MGRRGRIAAALGITLSLVLVPLGARAQQAAKVYRIGVLANAFDTSEGPSFEAFLDGLRKLGYVEGRNVDIEWRSSEGEADRLPALAASLVRSKVDVILAASLRPARAAAEATKTTPIVFIVAADPVAQGLVANLARPGGNLTGLATLVPGEVAEKVLQMLKELVPKAARVAVMTNPANPVNQQVTSQVLPAAAQRLNITLLRHEVGSSGDLQAAFEATLRERPDALYVLGDAITFIYRARITEFAAKNRLPAMYSFRGAVDAGGLMSYGPSGRDLFRRAATYVDRIFKGANPGELAVEQPSKFELVINLKSAKALGLTIPPSLLRQADDVIK